jgi:Flp pilus assembly protein protease CpaA
MTVVFVAITVTAVFASGVFGGVVGLVTVAIRREERNHTLIRPAPDRATCAARGLNGVYVRAPGGGEASHHSQETPA